MFRNDHNPGMITHNSSLVIYIPLDEGNDDDEEEEDEDEKDPIVAGLSCHLLLYNVPILLPPDYSTSNVRTYKILDFCDNYR